MSVTLAFAVLCVSGAKALPQPGAASDARPAVVPAPVNPDAAAAIAAAPPADITHAALPVDIAVQPLTDEPSPVQLSPDVDLSRITAASLPELVDQVPVPAILPRDIECLAGAVYFEAKSESLAGQLAVGRVIVARTTSGRFPGSYCGVVYQRSQFSFVRKGTMPMIDRSSHTWHKAVKIALIAHHGAWKSEAEGALFFHAAWVRPAAGKARIARIDHQIFYR